jgi:hypothetical protein
MGSVLSIHGLYRKWTKRGITNKQGNAHENVPGNTGHWNWTRQNREDRCRLHFHFKAMWS